MGSLVIAFVLSWSVACQSLNVLGTAHYFFLNFAWSWGSIKYKNWRGWNWKILIKELSGTNCHKFSFLKFSRKPVVEISFFCLIVECYRAYHLDMVPCLGESFIHDLLGDGIGIRHFDTSFWLEICNFLFFYKYLDVNQLIWMRKTISKFSHLRGQIKVLSVH